MLVLKRPVDSRTLVGPDLVVVVCRVKDHAVKLGFAAPPSLSIVRAEARDRSPNPRQFRPDHWLEDVKQLPRPEQEALLSRLIEMLSPLKGSR